ncbi:MULTISPECIES: hypothetical protein [unclassified Carboxylicivirga]|uniref:hypothetical protein n=1 Tax=Carboxylicivirga TaxID=1628153 RepID=UPI003D33BD5E
MIPPLIYTPERSIEVFKKTEEFLIENPDLKLKIEKLSWIYHSLHNIIPTTMQSFWSGHSFPYNESWEEIQISFNLICFGLYKQAMTSLRSTLELGLLSVYYNINDDGHNAVKKWLSSADSKEADTPKIQDVWKILLQHENIKKFQEQIDIKGRLLKLGFLHNYVHTKGHVFSNKLGKLKSNYQTFEKDYIEKWINTLEEIVIIVMTLHLLKYPAGLIQFDYSRKFGIDIPSFSHLREHEIENLTKYLPTEYFQLLQEISNKDQETINFLEWVNSHPDITEEDVENQIVEMDKMDIERQGIEDYKRQQLIIYRVEDFNDLSDKVKDRINKLEKWAIDNNFIEPKFKMKN